MTRELLIQALEALETCSTLTARQWFSEDRVDAAREAIRAHLAQPQGEPAAWNAVTPNAPTSTTGVMFTHPAHTEAEVQELLLHRRDGDANFLIRLRRILGVP